MPPDPVSTLNMDTAQFTLLAIAAAAAAYIGTAAGGVRVKIGKSKKAGEGREARVPYIVLLVLLMAADLLLILIAFFTAYRIKRWASNDIVSQKYDENLLFCLFVGVIFFSVLHILQYVAGFVRIGSKPVPNSNPPQV